MARAHIEQLEAIAGRRFTTLLLAGGVARGTLWPQVIADVLGREVSVADRPEATVRGAALAAAVGAGWHADLSGAAALSPEAQHGRSPPARRRPRPTTPSTRGGAASTTV